MVYGESKIEYLSNIRTRCHPFEDLFGEMPQKGIKIAFVGRISSGKSTLINNVLGEQILPTGIGRTTMVTHEICGGDDQEYAVDYGAGMELPTFETTESLSQYLTDNISSKTTIKLRLPRRKHEIMKSGIVILDTPGLGYSEEMDAKIESACSGSHIFVVVVDGVSALGLEEMNFIKMVEKNQFIVRIIFVFTHMDLVRQSNMDNTEEQHEMTARQNVESMQLCIHNVDFSSQIDEFRKSLNEAAAMKTFAKSVDKALSCLQKMIKEQKEKNNHLLNQFTEDNSNKNDTTNERTDEQQIEDLLGLIWKSDKGANSSQQLRQISGLFDKIMDPINTKRKTMLYEIVHFLMEPWKYYLSPGLDLNKLYEAIDEDETLRSISANDNFKIHSGKAFKTWHDKWKYMGIDAIFKDEDVKKIFLLFVEYQCLEESSTALNLVMTLKSSRGCVSERDDERREGTKKIEKDIEQIIEENRQLGEYAEYVETMRNTIAKRYRTTSK